MLISIVLPISQQEPTWLVERCLQWLAEEASDKLEVIICAQKNTLQKYADWITRAKGVVITLDENGTKSRARNRGILAVRGEYILNLDVDTILEKGGIAKLITLAEDQIEAATIHHQYQPLEGNYLSYCRQLEGKLIAADPQPIPIFLKKERLLSLGLYQENYDPLDDLGIKVAISKTHLTAVSSDIIGLVMAWNCWTVGRSFWRMYQRGSTWAKLKEVPWTRELRKKLPRCYSLLLLKAKNWPFIPGLILLKMADLAGFVCGLYYGQQKEKEATQYLNNEKAVKYDRQRANSSYQKYKDYKEKILLKKVIDQYQIKEVVEFGCGTGRITKFLQEAGVKVTPTDNSPAMLNIYTKNNRWLLSSPVITDITNANQLPKSKQTSMAIRLLWHLAGRAQLNKAFGNLAKSATEMIVADFVSRPYWLNKLIPHPFDKTILTKEETIKLGESVGYILVAMYPLEVLPPYWLDLIPKTIACQLFPYCLAMENRLAKRLGAWRWLAVFAKHQNDQPNQTGQA